MAELGSSKIYGDLNISNNLKVLGSAFINNLDVLDTVNFNVGRGDVYIENNANDNASGAGITLRVSLNPASGDPASVGSMFSIRSSGEALRLAVGQSETSTGSNDLRTNQVIASSFTGTGITDSRTSSSTTVLLSAKAMNDHRTSTDHDGRYFTSLPSHNIAFHSDATGITNSRTSTSTTLLLNAAGMNNHRTSGDHDSRYVQTSGDSITSLRVTDKFILGNSVKVQKYCSYFNSTQSGPIRIGYYTSNSSYDNIQIKGRVYVQSSSD
jgi:hypothetical protein